MKTKETYGLRKTTRGVASVLLGISLVGASVQLVDTGKLAQTNFATTTVQAASVRQPKEISADQIHVVDFTHSYTDGLGAPQDESRREAEIETTVKLTFDERVHSGDWFRIRQVNRITSVFDPSNSGWESWGYFYQHKFWIKDRDTGENIAYFDGGKITFTPFVEGKDVQDLTFTFTDFRNNYTTSPTPQGSPNKVFRPNLWLLINDEPKALDNKFDVMARGGSTAFAYSSDKAPTSARNQNNLTKRDDDGVWTHNFNTGGTLVIKTNMLEDKSLTTIKKGDIIVMEVDNVWTDLTVPATDGAGVTTAISLGEDLAWYRDTDTPGGPFYQVGSLDAHGLKDKDLIKIVKTNEKTLAKGEKLVVEAEMLQDFSTNWIRINGSFGGLKLREDILEKEGDPYENGDGYVLRGEAGNKYAPKFRMKIIRDGKELHSGGFGSTSYTTSRGSGTGSVSGGKITHEEDKVENDLPFETVVTVNPELAAGETKVIAPGKKGLRVRKYEVEKIDGKEEGRILISDEVARQPEDRVIEIGLGSSSDEHQITGSERSQMLRDVPYETEYTINDRQDLGWTQTTAQGVVGQDGRTITYRLDTNGKRIGSRGEYGSWKRLKDPVNKGVQWGSRVYEDHDVPFDYYTIVDARYTNTTPELVQKGVLGNDHYTLNAQVNKETGKEIPNSTRTEIRDLRTRTKDPVDEIHRVGLNDKITNDPNYDKNESLERKLPFDTVYRTNDDLKLGEEKVVREGKEGLSRRSAMYKVDKDGKVLEKVETNDWETIEEPVDKIVERGTKSNDNEDLPFKRYVIVDPKLDKDEEIVEQEGELGREEITYKNKLDHAGKVVGKEETSRKKVKDPVDEIIRVGLGHKTTGQGRDEYNDSYEMVTPYDTIYKINPEMKLGEEKTVQEGENGKMFRTVKYEVDKNGMIVEKLDVSEWELIKKSVDEIIERGVADEGTESVPYERYVIVDPTLRKDQAIVEQKGKLGEDKVFFEAELDESGKEIGRKEVKRERTTEPVDEIVRVGLGHKVPNEAKDPDKDDDDKDNERSFERDIPFETEWIEDPTLPIGEKKLVEKGNKGKEIQKVKYKVDENDRIIEEIESSDWEVVKEPNNEIWAWGTKVEEDEETPFKRYVIVDPNLKSGEKIVEQKGKKGKDKVTYETEVDKETGEEIDPANRKETGRKRITPPVDEIIRVGTDDPVAEQGGEDPHNDTFEDEIPYESVERENPDLPEGERRVIQEGKNGKKEKVVTYEVDEDGNIIKKIDEGEWVVVTPPEKEIIEVGTKKPEEPEEPQEPLKRDKGKEMPEHLIPRDGFEADPKEPEEEPEPDVIKPGAKGDKFEATGTGATGLGLAGMFSALLGAVGIKRKRDRK